MVDGNLAIRSGDPHSKEMRQFPEVLHFEFLGQLRLHSCNISSVLAGNKQIVDPNRDVDVSFGVNVKARIGARPDKSDFVQKSVDFLVPHMRRLFKAVKGS